MGKSPEPKTIEEIKKRAMSIKGVKGLNSLRAHYVGNHIHVEVHIELDKMTPLIEVHSISNKVGKRIEQMDNMRAFVHADPV
jgi:divalent metal cation (Fe/Co/Zn/Cd) transporter